MIEGYPPKETNARLLLPPPYLQALGNIAAHYAFLESATEITIWAFLDLDYVHGTAITSGMGTISRLQLLTILANIHLTHIPDALSNFLEILKIMDAVRIKRNDMIHAMWKHEGNRKAQTVFALKRSTKGEVKTSTRGVKLSEMRELAGEIYWLTCGLQAFIEVIFPDFPVPWPRTDDRLSHQKRG